MFQVGWRTEVNKALIVKLLDSLSEKRFIFNKLLEKIRGNYFFILSLFCGNFYLKNPNDVEFEKKV